MRPGDCVGCTEGTTSPPVSVCEKCAAEGLFASEMVSDLLRAEVAFVAARDRAMVTDGRTDLPLSVYVLASDTFAACADAEELTLEQVPVLYEHWRREPIWGPVAWLVEVRKQRPLFRVENVLRRRELWTERMEALP